MPAWGRELDCIADQVDEHLFQLDRITIEHWPGRWIPADDDLDLGGFCGQTQHHQALVEKNARLRRHVCDLQLARLHFCEVEHLLDEGKEMHAALVDVMRIL